MANESIIKSLSRETKALVIVSEFEARRMPMFQMRAILHELLLNEEEKKVIIDLVENDLKATGYHPDQINSFLQDILNDHQGSVETNLRVTRRLRSPFARGFEDASPELVPPPGAAVSSSHALGATDSSHGLPAANAPRSPAATVGYASALKSIAGQGTRVAITRPPIQAPKPKVPLGTGVIPPPTGNIPKQPAGQRLTQGGAYFGNAPTGVQVAQKPKILLADDDKRIRIVFRMCLERLGCQVVEAEDGNEAWKAIVQGGLSLVVLDMKMPGLHGLEVVTRMTTQQIDLPIIICSAYDQLKEEFVIATHPNLRYLVKPVAAEALEGAVKELIGLEV